MEVGLLELSVYRFLTLRTLIIYKGYQDKMMSSFTMKNIYWHNKLLISSWIIYTRKLRYSKNVIDSGIFEKNLDFFQTQESIQDFFSRRNTFSRWFYINTSILDCYPTPGLILFLLPNHYTLYISTQAIDMVVISWDDGNYPVFVNLYFSIWSSCMVLPFSVFH